MPYNVALSYKPERPSLLIDLAPENIPGWCLELSLLWHDLISDIPVRGGGSDLAVHLGRTRGTHGSTFSISGDGVSLSILLDENALGSMLYFLLGYYRDGGAPVDHIDIEAADSEGGGNTLPLTIKVSPRGSDDWRVGSRSRRDLTR